MVDDWSEASSSSTSSARLSSLGSLVLKHSGLQIDATDDSEEDEGQDAQPVVAVGWESWSDSGTEEDDGDGLQAGVPSTTWKLHNRSREQGSFLQGTSRSLAVTMPSLLNHSGLFLQKMECAVRHDIESAQHHQHSILLAAWRSLPRASQNFCRQQSSTEASMQPDEHIPMPFRHPQPTTTQLVNTEEQLAALHIHEGRGRQRVSEEERQRRLAFWKLEWHGREQLLPAVVKISDYPSPNCTKSSIDPQVLAFPGPAPEAEGQSHQKPEDVVPQSGSTPTLERQAALPARQASLVVEEERSRRVTSDEEFGARTRMWRDWRVQGMELEHQLRASRLAGLQKAPVALANDPSLQSSHSGKAAAPHRPAPAPPPVAVPVVRRPSGGGPAATGSSPVREFEQKAALFAVETVHRELAAREEATSFAMIRLKWSNLRQQLLPRTAPSPMSPSGVTIALACPPPSVSPALPADGAKYHSAKEVAREEERLELRREQSLRQLERLLSSEADFRQHVQRSEAGQFTTLLTNETLHRRSVERMERDHAARAERQARLEGDRQAREQAARPPVADGRQNGPQANGPTTPSTPTSHSSSGAVTAECPVAPKAAASPKQLLTAADYRDEGNRLHRAGQYIHAISMYTKAIALQPNSSLLHANRASSYLMCERYQECISDCDRSIALDTTNFKAFSRRGRCHQMLGRLAEAVRDFERAYHLEGGAQARRQLEDARAELRKAQNQQSQGTQDYYTLLDVPKDAGDGAIRKAYKKACLKWHPDKWCAGTEAEVARAVEMFKRVAEAQDVLLDPHKRLRYDADQAWGRFSGGPTSATATPAAASSNTSSGGRAYYRPRP